jgi:hypothetical protein
MVTASADAFRHFFCYILFVSLRIQANLALAIVSKQSRDVTVTVSLVN